MDFKQILGDASVSAVRKSIGILSGIIVIPVITRWLGEGAYGIWTTVLATIGLFATVGGLHLHGALIRYIQEQSNEQTFIDILSLTTIVGSVLTVFLVLGGVAYNRLIGFQSSVFGKLLLPAALLVGGRLFIGILFNYVRAQKRVKLFEALGIGRKLIETAVIVAAFWWTRDLVVALWALVFITGMVNFVLLVILSPRELLWPNIHNFRRYLEYGVPMVPKEIAGSLLQHADKFLILFFLGPAATGIYAVAYGVGQFLTSFSSIFNSTLYPRVTAAWENNERDRLSTFYNTFLRWYCILLFPAIVGLGLLASSILRFISTPTVAAQGASLIPILAIGFGLQGLEFALSYPLAAAEHTKRIALITSVAVMLNIVLNIALISEIEIFGAAVATTLSFALRTGWLYHDASELIELTLPLSGLIKSGIATVVMAAVLYTVPVIRGPIQLIVFPILGSIIFFVVFLVIHGPTDQEVQKATNLYKKKL